MVQTNDSEENEKQDEAAITKLIDQKKEQVKAFKKILANLKNEKK